MALRPWRARATLAPVQRVVIVVFDRLQSLDAAGPFEVLRLGDYQVELASPTGEAVRSKSGLLLGVDRALSSVRGPLDTLIVAGGHIDEAMHDPVIHRALRRLAPQSRRIASVCSGAFVLAEAGLLDGRRATTHWGGCDRMANDYPAITVPSALNAGRCGKYRRGWPSISTLICRSSGWLASPR
jgi:transcriptional regulator GlxA family with amidase domain